MEYVKKHLGKPTCFAIIIVMAIILVIVSLICVCILFSRLPWHAICQTETNYLAILVSSSMAIANAILLYLTLKSQNRGIENEKEAHRQERFETTFFNLLESHRKLLDGMVVNTPQLNDHLQIVYVPICGRKFFSFAKQEMKNINESFSNAHYAGKFDEKEDSKSIEAIIEEYEQKDPENILATEMQERLARNYQHNRIKFTNLIYNINNEKWMKYHQDIHRREMVILTFSKSYYTHYEQYVRSLSQLLLYVLNEYQTDSKSTKKYTNFIKSQMSSDELAFLDTLSISDSDFKEVYNRINLKTKTL
jgi:hypothetical protein